MTGPDPGRVQQALDELLRAVRQLDAPDLSGFTSEEQDAALSLFVESEEQDMLATDRWAQQLVYLMKHAPGLSIQEGVRSLTPEQLEEFHRLGGLD